MLRDVDFPSHRGLGVEEGLEGRMGGSIDFVLYIRRIALAFANLVEDIVNPIRVLWIPPCDLPLAISLLKAIEDILFLLDLPSFLRHLCGDVLRLGVLEGLGGILCYKAITALARKKVLLNPPPEPPSIVKEPPRRHPTEEFLLKQVQRPKLSRHWWDLDSRPNLRA